MKKPLISLERSTSNHPIIWGIGILLLGSGVEMLVTQKLLGTVLIQFILERFSVQIASPFLLFILHGCALILGLVCFAFSAHIISRTWFSQRGEFRSLFTLFLFISGVMAIVSTFLFRVLPPAHSAVLFCIPLCSVALYIVAIRECYHIHIGRATIAGVIPLSVAVIFFLV